MTGPGRLAAERLPHPRAGAVLRGHLLPARAAPGHAELAPGARGDRRGLGRAARRDPRRAAARIVGAPARRRAAAAVRARRSTRAALDARGGRRCAAHYDPRERRLRRRAQVPARVGDRVPAAPRRDRDGRAHAARDGVRRHVRPGRRRLRALLGGRRTGSSPTSRRCSTTTRCSRARTCTAGRSPASRCSERVCRGDARLGAARDARPRGRLLLRARRRLRGRGGQVLRLDARRVREALAGEPTPTRRSPASA